MINRKNSNKLIHKKEWQVPALFASAAMVVLIVLAFISLRNDEADSSSSLDNAVTQISDNIHHHLQNKVDYLKLLADDMSSNILDEPLFHHRITQLVEDHPYLINVTWSDEDYVIRWTAPFEPNKQIIGLTLSLPESKKASREATASKRPVWTNPFQIIQGHTAIEVYVPVFRDNKFVGTFGGIHSIKSLLQHSIPHNFKDDYYIAISDSEGRQYSVNPNTRVINEDLIRSSQINLHGSQIFLEVSAYEDGIHWSLLILVFICIILIIGMTLSLWSLRKQLVERKLAEEKINEANYFKESLLNASPDIIYIYDLELNKNVYSNEGIIKILGYSVKEIQDLGNKVVQQLMHPDDFQIYLLEIFPLYKKLKPGEILQHKYRMKSKKGQWHTLLSKERIFKQNPDQSAKQIFGVITDITDQKKAEEALQASEERFRTQMIQSPLVMEIYDLDGLQIEVNKAYENLWGFPASTSVNKFNVLKSKEVEETGLIVYVKQAYAGEAVTVPEYVFDPTGETESGGFGRVRWLSTRIYPLKDSNGKVLSIVITHEDITDRKVAEEELAKEVKLSDAIINSLPGMFYLYDDKGAFIRWNKNHETTTGYTAVELSKMSMLDWFKEDDKKTFSDAVNKIYESGEARIQISPLFKNGLAGLHEFTAHHLEIGNQTYLIGIAMDISEVVRLQELESRAKRLESAGQIAGQVAHDFNNMLAPLMAYPDFIRDELPKNHPALTYLDDIENSAKKIAEINQQLLTLGRRGHYNQHPLNLNTIILQAVRELNPLPDSLSIETVLDQNLLHFNGGASQIHRILLNLLSNAIEAVQDNGRIIIKTENQYVDEVSIAYGRVPKGEFIKLTVTDTGCGIPDENLQYIFDPFFTSKTTDKKRGSGLGLSVVDAVIKDHHGYLDLTTEVGKGTSFYLYFPITRNFEETTNPEKASTGTETILIVDDDDIQRDVSTQLLEKLGYKVNSVESGKKAIEFLRENPHDIIVLDMVMPGGIDGAETYRQILDINPTQKAIILSGFSETDRVLEAQKLGAGVFVRKPVTKEVIAKAVRTELDRKGKNINC